MADKRDEIIAAARARLGIPYALPPSPPATTDCSLWVRDVFEAVGLPFSPGVRVAEQERRDTVKIDFSEVLPGDILTFEGTYDAPDPDPNNNPDGHIASHIGISLGAGTFRMLNALEPRSAETRIDTPYWQSKILDARRHPALVGAVPEPGGPLPDDPDHLFSFAELWPTIKAAGDEFGFDPQVLAGIMKQESGFRNWRVHRDGTGHGLLGLDDNGMLPAFERWSGIAVGRGQNARSIPIVPQIRYAAFALADYARRLGGPYAASRAWHRGEGGMNDQLGRQYEQLIRAHVASLFAGGEPTIPPPPPPPPVESPFVVGEGILKAMKDRGDSPASSELFFKSQDGRDEWSECFSTSGRRYIWLPSAGRVFAYDPAA